MIPRLLFAVPFIAVGFAGGAAAAPISIDVGNGLPSDPPQFTWQGLTFELQNQPGSRVSADHRVEGDTEGNLDIILEEGQSEATGPSSKVTYGTSFSGASHFKLGFEQLSEETSTFSNLQGYFRRPDEGQATVVQLLVGVDTGNPGSPFAGLNTRADNETGFPVNDFVDNTPLEASGHFQMDTQPDGTTTAQVDIDGRQARIERDMSTLTDFEFTELLLQVETFQSDSEFQSQFPEGQTFTYTNVAVPGPMSAAMFAVGLACIAGLGAAIRRHKPA